MLRPRAFGLAACAALLAGCPGPPEPSIEPLFPEDYASAGWTEVRDCRRSIDHDLTNVRVWANPIAQDAYLARTGPLPTGSVLLKEEYADDACTDLIGWSLMRREPAGYAPLAGEWRWQEIDADRAVVSDGSRAECFLCHERCGVAPDGFDWTCAVPDGER